MHDTAMEFQQLRPPGWPAELVWIDNDLYDARHTVAQSLYCGFNETVPVGGSNGVHGALQN